jgi:hypothetical protein
VNAHEKKVTEERIAMLSILEENEQLRRMCGELQRVVDSTVQSGVAEASSSREDSVPSTRDVPSTRVPTKKNKWFWFPRWG